MILSEMSQAHILLRLLMTWQWMLQHAIFVVHLQTSVSYQSANLHTLSVHINSTEHQQYCSKHGQHREHYRPS